MGAAGCGQGDPRVDSAHSSVPHHSVQGSQRRNGAEQRPDAPEEHDERFDFTHDQPHIVEQVQQAVLVEVDTDEAPA